MAIKQNAPAATSGPTQTSYYTVSLVASLDCKERRPFDLSILLKIRLGALRKSTQPSFSIRDIYLLGEQDAIPVIRAYQSGDQSMQSGTPWSALVCLYETGTADDCHTFFSHQFITDRSHNWVTVLQSCSFEGKSYLLFSSFNEQSAAERSLKPALDRCIPTGWVRALSFCKYKLR